MVNEEISSESIDTENKKTYEFVGEKLNKVLNDETLKQNFWEKMEEQLEEADESEVEQVVNDFRLNKVDESFVDDLLELYNGL